MAAGRTDLTENNGYIPEEKGSVAIQATIANSVVEAFARRENMASRTKGVPRFVSDAPVIVAEGVDIPNSDTTLDEIVLTARKYAQIFNISEEDINDSLVDTLNTYKREWASLWARKFDNACLGVTGKDTAETIANTRQAIRGFAELTLQGRKSMRGEGAITESEGKLAERAFSGDIDSLTAQEIKQIANASKRVAEYSITEYNRKLDTLGKNPEMKDIVEFYKVTPIAPMARPGAIKKFNPATGKVE